jgi:urease
MKLAPREVEKLGLHNAGYLSQKRLARGLRLNYVEAVALIATQVPLILTFFFVFYYYNDK